MTCTEILLIHAFFDLNDESPAFLEVFPSPNDQLKVRLVKVVVGGPGFSCSLVFQLRNPWKRPGIS